MRRLFTAIVFCSVALGFGTVAPAADLTEDQIRRIAEEVANRVAREVADKVAREVAAEVAAEAAKAYLEGAGSGEIELVFTEEFLNDPEHIASGKAIWKAQCALCHGARAYPGKAPKLKPKRYTPEFVYSRITNGFRKMPPWKDVYDDEERMDIVAWVLSRKFSP